MVVHRGATLVSAVDDQGRLRPKNTYLPGKAFGTTSLIEGKSRHATVRAVKGAVEPGRSSVDGAELIILDRRDLQHAFADNPGLWREGIQLYDRVQAARATQPSFDWLEEEESIVWHGRGHWLWLAGPLAVWGLTFLVFLVLVIAGEFFAGLPQSFTNDAGSRCAHNHRFPFRACHYLDSGELPG